MFMFMFMFSYSHAIDRMYLFFWIASL